MKLIHLDLANLKEDQRIFGAMLCKQSIQTICSFLKEIVQHLVFLIQTLSILSPQFQLARLSHNVKPLKNLNAPMFHLDQEQGSFYLYHLVFALHIQLLTLLQTLLFPFHALGLE